MRQDSKIANQRRGWLVFLALSLMLAATAIQAQQASEAPAPAGGWHYELDLLGWGSGLSGDVGPAIHEYQIHASFSDLTEYLDFAAMGHFEARKEKWGFTLDAFYVNLGHSVDNRFGYPVELDLESLILGAAGTYRVYQGDKSSFDLTFGARYNEVKTGLEPRWTPAYHKNIAWTDPVIGFQGGVRLSKAWTFGYRGDIGGFGAGSDFTWLGILQLEAQLSEHVGLGFGFLGYGVDYKKGSGYQEFVYDTTMYGPFLGIAWRW
jgi:hypothetical protein